MKQSSFYVLCVLGLSLGGCHKIGFSSQSDSLSNIEQPKLSSSAQQSGDSVGGDAPLSIEIGQSFISNEQLTVKAYVSAKTILDPSQVLVSLVGLNEGHVVVERKRRLSEEFQGKILNPNERVQVLFSVPAENLNEYQVKCSWGTDAIGDGNSQSAEVQSAANVSANEIANPAAVQTGAVLMEDTKLESRDANCSKGPCDTLYTVTTNLVNRGSQPAQSIRLALGLVWTEQGQPANLPEKGQALTPSEELIDLGETVLAPGDSKTVRVNVDQPVPTVPGGAFIPNLRLVDYQTVAGVSNPFGQSSKDAALTQ